MGDEMRFVLDGLTAPPKEEDNSMDETLLISRETYDEMHEAQVILGIVGQMIVNDKGFDAIELLKMLLVEEDE